ncbi:C40 family peptidase [Desulforamulus ferrireducens]|uniref:Glycoside hydrolase n=1 Tax=Desulforamulus ferrireducens TaxID=1833852 RepID=A0A1S6IY96_9FIRM|nr:C40 family peptidase [Desulforamulus ferrireducens]AQS59742.1 glycoside hydrolase [Desulforamulus ferrireducens]
MPDLREVEAGTTVITAVPLVDVLEQPQAGIPLVTQSLLGWPALVMGVEGDWLHIQTLDGSPGWARVDHFTLADVVENGTMIEIKQTAVPLYQGTTQVATLYLGSRLLLLEADGDFYQVALPNGEQGLIARNHAVILNNSAHCSPQEVLRVANQFTGAPYLWGGMSVQGIDCSGLTYMSYFSQGYQLPRNAQDQFKVGCPVAKENLKAGDLVFFSTIDPGPSHVGIYLGDELFLNARSKEGVTVTSFNDAYFAPRYLGARRYV